MCEQWNVKSDAHPHTEICCNALVGVYLSEGNWRRWWRHVEQGHVRVQQTRSIRALGQQLLAVGALRYFLAALVDLPIEQRRQRDLVGVLQRV
jgi:hypothetical protein